MTPPLVTVVLPTRDRPAFLPVALRCYAEQTYPRRELIVVDSGTTPADEAAVRAVGGTVVRVPPGTPLGEKLNAGAEAGRGAFIQKMDDDDWYAPALIERLVGRLHDAWRVACFPAFTGVAPYRVLLVARWEVRAIAGHFPGATLCIPRSVWLERPFRPIGYAEDTTFWLDQRRLGAELLPLADPSLFLAVRHAGLTDNRGHTWVRQGARGEGAAVDAFLSRQPAAGLPPEALLPPWAVAFYAALRDGRGGGTTNGEPER